jgi:translation initiation factor IF-2
VTGTLDALRHIKKDILEARKGSDCGMSFEDFLDAQEADRIQSFEVIVIREACKLCM